MINKIINNESYKNRPKKAGRGILCITIAILCMFFCITAFASEEKESRVFDQAGLLTEEEVKELEQQLARLQEKIKMDLVVVTTDDSQGKTSEEYADDFYDNGDYGRENSYSGALFLIDMDNRTLYISTSGDMIRLLTDERIENILDLAYAGAEAEDYYESACQFISGVENWYDKGIQSGQYNYDRETGRISIYRSIRWYEGLTAAVIAFMAGIIPCIAVKGSYAMKRERRLAQQSHIQYRGQCHFGYSSQNDNLINKSVTQRIIPRPVKSSGSSSNGTRRSSAGRSTTHRSSSGRSHGGGGRKF